MVGHFEDGDMVTSDIMDKMFHFGETLFFWVKDHCRLFPSIPDFVKEADLFQLFSKHLRIGESFAELNVFHFQEVESLFHVSDFINEHWANVIIIIEVDIEVTFPTICDRVSVLVLELLDSVLIVLEE